MKTRDRCVFLMVAVTLVALFLRPATAEETIKRHQIMIDPLALLYHSMSVSYEYAANSRAGLGISVFGNVFGRGRISDTEFSSYGAAYTYYRYRNRENPFKGVFGAVRIEYAVSDYWDTDGPGYAEDVHMLGVLGGGGYRFNAEGLVLGILLGYQVSFEISEGESFLSPNKRPFGGLGIFLIFGVAFTA